MTEIEKVFSFIPKTFNKEFYLKGEYSERLKFSEYFLFNWRKNTYILENPESCLQDAVFPPHPESAYLSSLIPSTLIQKNFLDVGVGSGILSIDAAKKGWKVVGVDINKKALKIASINAKLNDCRNIQYKYDDLAKSQEKDFFDCCIANLPFEPTPLGKTNFIHSDGGNYGDKLIKDFIPIVENLMKIDGYVVLPSFSLLKNNKSILEKHLEELSNTNFIRGIIRLSLPLELSLLSYRFENSKKAYSELTKEGYSHFVIDIGLLKKTKEESSFIGILNKNDTADRSWIMPLGRSSFTKVKQS